MRDATLVDLWLKFSRKLVPRGASVREIETAQNAFLAGALGVYLQLERAIESSDDAKISLALRKLRRELNLGMSGRKPKRKTE